MPKTTLRDVARNLTKPAPKVLSGNVLTEPTKFDRSYPFTGSDGETVTVYVKGTERWYYDSDLNFMALPPLPNSVHGKYYAEQISRGLTRREYRKLRDDFMLEGS